MINKLGLSFLKRALQKKCSTSFLRNELPGILEDLQGQHMTFQHDGAPIFFNRLAYLNENYINKWIEHGHKNQQISVH